MKSGVLLLISLIVHVCEVLAQAPHGVVVSTFEELGEAFANADVQVVEIRQHLRGAQSMVLPSKRMKIVVGNCALDTPRESVVFDEIFRQPYYHPRQCVIDFAGEPGFEVGVDSALWLTDLVIANANRGEGQLEQFPKASQSAPPLSPAPRPSSVGLPRRLLSGSRGLLNAPVGPPQVDVLPTDLPNSGGALKARISSRAYASRVLFYANSAHNGGAAAFEEGSFGSFQNCTFLYNDASGLGGALFLDVEGKADVASSVFDGDIATIADSAYVGFAASLRLDATCQAGGTTCYTAPAVTFENIPGLQKGNGVVYVPQGAASGEDFLPLKDAPSPFHPPNSLDTQFSEFVKSALPREPAGLIAAAAAAPVVALTTAPRPPVQPQTSLDASPASLEASNLSGAPTAGGNGGSSGGRKRSVWDRHKAAFIPLIVVCCLSVAAIAFFMFKIRGLTPREDFGDLSEPPTDTTNGLSSADPNSLPPEISPASNTSIFSSFTLQSDGSEAPGIAAARSTLSSLTVKSFKERSVELWQYGAAAAAAAGAPAAGAATAASAAASSAAAGWRDEGTAAVELAPASLQDDDEDSRGRLGQQQSKEGPLAEMNGHTAEGAARGGVPGVSVEADADAPKPSPKVVGGAPKSLRSSRRGAASVRSRSLDDSDEAADAAMRATPSPQPESPQPAAPQPAAPAVPPAGAFDGGPNPSSPAAAHVAATPAAVASAPRSLRSGRSQRSAAAHHSSGDAVDAEAAAAAAEAAAVVLAAAAPPPPPPPAGILDTGGAEQQQSLLDHDIEDPFQPAPGPPSAAPAQPTSTPEPPTAAVPEPPTEPGAPPASIPMYDPASFSGSLTSGSNAGGGPTQRSPPPASEQSEGDMHSPDEKEEGDDFAGGNRTRGGGEDSDEAAEGEGTQKTRKWSRRGVLEKARRPNKIDPKKTDTASSSGESERSDGVAAPSAAAASPFGGRAPPGARSPPPADADAAPAQPRLPLMAEAAALGEVEKMPQDLEGASSGPLSAHGNSGPFPNNKLRASSWHMAKEVKQSRRNRKLAAQKGMLNRGEAPAAQLFKISEQAEIRYTNNGLLYEVPADEVASNPSSANSQPLGSGSTRLASRSARIDEEGSDEEPPSERMTDTSPL